MVDKRIVDAYKAASEATSALAEQLGKNPWVNAAFRQASKTMHALADIIGGVAQPEPKPRAKGGARTVSKGKSPREKLAKGEVDETGAAKLLRLNKQTLMRHRAKGTAPKHRRVGRKVIYRVADLKGWKPGRRS